MEHQWVAQEIPASAPGPAQAEEQVYQQQQQQQYAPQHHEYAQFVAAQHAQGGEETAPNQVIMSVSEGDNHPTVSSDGTGSVVVEMSPDEFENMMSAGGVTLHFRSEGGEQVATVPVPSGADASQLLEAITNSVQQNRHHASEQQLQNAQEQHQHMEYHQNMEQNAQEPEQDLQQEAEKVPAQLPEGLAYIVEDADMGFSRNKLLGVVTSKEVGVGEKFGPFKGDFVSEAIGCNNAATWEICVKGRTWFYIDGSTDPDNWMMHVAVAQNKEEQNLEAFQFYGNIFFRTTKPLSDGDELKVFYEDDYRSAVGYLAGLDDLKVDPESGRFGCELCVCQYANSKSMIRHMKFVHGMTMLELDKTPPEQTPHCQRDSHCKNIPLVLQDSLKPSGDGMIASYLNFYQQKHMNAKKAKAKKVKKGEEKKEIKKEGRKPLNPAFPPQEQQKSANLPEESGSLLMETENNPEDIENHPEEMETLPKEIENLPKETENHPAETENRRRTRGKKFVLPPGLIKKEPIDADEDEKKKQEKKRKEEEKKRKEEKRKAEEKKRKEEEKKKLKVVTKKKKTKVEEEDEEEKEYICKKCDKKFTSLVQLREHNAFHREEKELKPVCEVCGLVCENKRTLVNHKMLHEPDTHQCHVCNRMFRKKAACIYHLRHVHNEDVGDKHLRGKFSEKMERFVGTDPLPSEQEVFHPEAPKDMLGRRIVDACSKPRVFKCKYCPKRFPEHHLVSTHEKIFHLNSGDFRCDICQRTFIREPSLILHRRKHTKDRPFKCSSCPMSFGSESALRRHEPEHSGGRPFSCDICGASFRAKNAMNTHKRRIHSTKLMKCSFCDMTFKLKTSLDRHEKRHKGIRPFVCLTCGKAFGTKYSLQVHSNIHTGARPFECKLCHERFPTNNNLIYHMIKHGDPQIEMPLDNGASQETEETLQMQVEVQDGIAAITEVIASAGMTSA